MYLTVHKYHLNILDRSLIPATSMVPKTSHTYADNLIANTWTKGVKRCVSIHLGTSTNM